MKTNQNEAPPLTPLEMDESDIETCERAAKHLGYKQTAYTSSSHIWGLYCLPENPARGYSGQITRGGVFFKTRELGIVFLQDLEDIRL